MVKVRLIFAVYRAKSLSVIRRSFTRFRSDRKHVRARAIRGLLISKFLFPAMASTLGWRGLAIPVAAGAPSSWPRASLVGAGLVG
jgi:hypothetical protein